MRSDNHGLCDGLRSSRAPACPVDRSCALADARLRKLDCHATEVFPIMQRRTQRTAQQARVSPIADQSRRTVTERTGARSANRGCKDLQSRRVSSDAENSAIYSSAPKGFGEGLNPWGFHLKIDLRTRFFCRLIKIQVACTKLCGR